MSKLKIMNKLRSLLILSLVLLATSVAEALNVTNLRVQTLKNPSGIDTQTPCLSWQLSSESRSVVQAAYKISLMTADGSVVYDGSFVESDRSVNVPLDGVTLLPSTRYYWAVTVKDNQGNEAMSTEKAWFDTGLMHDGWGQAQWIKASNAPYGTVAGEDAVEGYTIETVMKVTELSGGVCFAGTDNANYYMWQVNIHDGNHRLRPHRWHNGNAACLAEVSLPESAGVSKDAVFTLRIEVNADGTTATTYINNVKVDTRQGEFRYGRFGLRASHDFGRVEQASYDSFKVTSDKGKVLYDYDFASVNPFTNGTLVNGWLNMKGGTSSDVYAWLAEGNPALRYTVETDMTLIRDNAAIVFGAIGNNTYYMWQINTFNNTNPMVRCHIYNNSNTPTVVDNSFTQYTKADLLGKLRHVCIEVDGNLIKTYIDDVLVNTYKDESGILAFGDVGFRVDNTATTPKEEAYFDNLKVTLYDAQGNKTTTVDEDFEDPKNSVFLNPVVKNIDGNNVCHMAVTGREYRMMQASTEGLPIFRKDFTLSKPVKSAFLYTTALGIYDLYINGKRVGHLQEDGSIVYDELKPGWTDYTKRVFYTQHEVSSLLAEGNNAMGALVAPGWWAGTVAKGYYGSPNTAFMGKLVINYEDGSQETVDSDLTWAVTRRNPLLLGEIYDGEIYDARQEWNWTEPGISLADWCSVAQDRQFKGVINPFLGQPVRTLDDLLLAPKSTVVYEGVKQTGTTFGEVNAINTIEGSQPIKLKAGQTAIVDFGQNFAGWIVFTAKGAAGTRLHVRFAEILNDTGDRNRRNDGPGGGIYIENLRSAKAELYYTLAGRQDGDTYRPTTTFWGFRYCEITTNDDVELTAVNGLPISSSYIDKGWVETSSPLVNQLFSNVVWGQRSNLLSVPTDCPQRDERLGWTADTQVFSIAGMLNADVAAFYRKWLTDLRDGQKDNGVFPDIAPVSWTEIGNGAWADAGVIVPWNVYLMTGDIEVIRENYDAMERYMGWLSTQSGGGYKYNGGGTAHGDWLSFANTDSRMVSVAYYAYDALLMSKMAQLLSSSDNDSYAQDAEAYAQLYDNIRNEFNNRYCASTGYLRQQTQTGYLLMLQFGLCKNEEQTQKAITRLERLITNNKERLNTGFVGTAILNQCLSEMGLNDKAYNLLLQRQCPSWLYSVDQGATTIWERWDSYTVEKGFNTPEMNSFNHYAYGAVAEWMYRYMAGINLDERQPGYKHIILRPCVDSRQTLPDGQERITSAKAAHDSQYGAISAAWTSLEGQLSTYSVEVPANTTATLYLPVASEDVKVMEQDRDVAEAEGVEFLGYENGHKRYSLGSGSYKFTTNVGTSISDVNADATNFKVYPNPTKNLLDVESADPLHALSLYTLSGAKVKSAEAPGISRLDLTGLPAGTYLLRASGSEGSYSAKVVKE